MKSSILHKKHGSCVLSYCQWLKVDSLFFLHLKKGRIHRYFKNHYESSIDDTSIIPLNKQKTFSDLVSGFFRVRETLLSQCHSYICLNQFWFQSLGRFYVMLQKQRVVIKNNHSKALIVVRVEEELLKSHNRSYIF